MGLRFIRVCTASAALAVAMAAATPSFAHGDQGPGTAPAGPDTRPEWQDGGPRARPMVDPRAREDWLSECRRRTSTRDNGVGGAVIGGLVGGVAGNRIAGRGHRTVGTIAGAAVGAVAGMAIDKAEDRGRPRDECETYFDSYYEHYNAVAYSYYPGYGAPYGYVPAGGYGCCQQAPMARQEPTCTETVEYVYEDVPVRPRKRVIPQKRVKIVPDKRIRTN
jgi:uncharacterized protein YcfJ